MNNPSDELEHPELLLLKELLTKIESLQEDRRSSAAVLFSSKWWDVLGPIYYGRDGLGRDQYASWSEIILDNQIRDIQLQTKPAHYSSVYVSIEVRTTPEGIELKLRTSYGEIGWQKFIFYDKTPQVMTG